MAPAPRTSVWSPEAAVRSLANAAAFGDAQASRAGNSSRKSSICVSSSFGDGIHKRRVPNHVVLKDVLVRLPSAIRAVLKEVAERHGCATNEVRKQLMCLLKSQHGAQMNAYRSSFLAQVVGFCDARWGLNDEEEEPPPSGTEADADFADTAAEPAEPLHASTKRLSCRAATLPATVVAAAAAAATASESPAARLQVAPTFAAWHDACWQTLTAAAPDRVVAFAVDAGTLTITKASRSAELIWGGGDDDTRGGPGLVGRRLPPLILRRERSQWLQRAVQVHQQLADAEAARCGRAVSGFVLHELGRLECVDGGDTTFRAVVRVAHLPRCPHGSAAGSDGGGDASTPACAVVVLDTEEAAR